MIFKHQIFDTILEHFKNTPFILEKNYNYLHDLKRENTLI